MSDSSMETRTLVFSQESRRIVCRAASSSWSTTRSTTPAECAVCVRLGMGFGAPGSAWVPAALCSSCPC
eukprot:2834302-Pleurochrysis_carterae.AAC.4